MATRALLHELLDEIADSELALVEVSLRRLVARQEDSLSGALADAPVDDEDIPAATLAKIDAAIARLEGARPPAVTSARNR